MKFLNYAVLFLFVFFTLSCNKNDEPKPGNNGSDNDDNIVPQSFAIDIPSSISADNSSNQRVSAVEDDPVLGKEIYRNLRLFIHVGDASAKVTSKIILAIRKYNLSKPDTIEYVSDDDNRNKVVQIEAGQSFEGSTYDYGMTIKDQDSSIAMQVFWNKNPVKGTAIMNPYHIDRNKHSKIHKSVMYIIDYSETSATYDKTMEVSISGLPAIKKDGIDNLKMFVGKKGNMLDIYGNSNHPNIKLIDSSFSSGRNYAFVAHADKGRNIGVAEVGLPPSSISTNNNILVDYSVRNVIEGEIEAQYNIDIDNLPQKWKDTVDYHLQNTQPPGYFVKGQGYVSNGDSIPANDGFTQEFIDLSGLKPFTPSIVAKLEVVFGN